MKIGKHFAQHLMAGACGAALLLWPAVGSAAATPLTSADETTISNDVSTGIGTSPTAASLETLVSNILAAFPNADPLAVAQQVVLDLQSAGISDQLIGQAFGLEAASLGQSSQTALDLADAVGSEDKGAIQYFDSEVGAGTTLADAANSYTGNIGAGGGNGNTMSFQSGTGSPGGTGGGGGSKPTTS